MFVRRVSNHYPFSEPKENKIGYDGIVKLLTDLQLDFADRRVLVLAWKLNAAEQAVFTKDEFVNGLTSMQVDSIDKLSEKLKQVRSV